MPAGVEAGARSTLGADAADRLTAGQEEELEITSISDDRCRWQEIYVQHSLRSEVEPKAVAYKIYSQKSVAGLRAGITDATRAIADPHRTRQTARWDLALCDSWSGSNCRPAKRALRMSLVRASRACGSRGRGRPPT